MQDTGVMRSRLEPVFVSSRSRRIFLLLHVPIQAERCVLFVPPFAEEMNKTRRQFRETAEALANRGIASVLPDLSGTGDSEGGFAESRWETWKSDLHAAIEWAEASGLSVAGVLAVRLGCSLAAEALADLGRGVLRSAFWQPVESGSQLMTQFLRTRVAASLMRDAKETVEGLKNRLSGGESLEVAGYELAPELWRSIEQVRLSKLLSTFLGNLRIFEIGRTESRTLSAGTRNLIACGTSNGLEVQAQLISGEPFWMSTEIVTQPLLTEATVSFLAGA